MTMQSWPTLSVLFVLISNHWPRRYSSWVLVGLLGAGVLSGVLSGCGQRTYKVTGTVTLDGDPVDQAVLLLLPLDTAQEAREARIVEGKFELQAMPGKVRVEIRGARQVGMGPMGPILKDFIPRRYSSESKLEETVTTGTNTWTFKLESGARVSRMRD